MISYERSVLGTGVTAALADTSTLAFQVTEDLGTAWDWVKDGWWIIAVVLVVYLIRMVRYWWLARRSRRYIHLATVRLKGDFVESVGPQEIGLILRAQLQEIVCTMQMLGSARSSQPTAAAVGPELRSLVEAFSIELPRPEIPETKIDPEWTIKLGPVQFPVSTVISFLKYFLHMVPIFFRETYLRSMFHVSLVSSETETQVMVHRGGGGRPGTGAGAGRGATHDSGPVASRTSITSVAPVTTLEQLEELLRDAAFFVLELKGDFFDGMNGRSMREFADGLVTLERYRQTGDRDLLNIARDSFQQAAAFDPANVEAIYFYGFLLLAERTRDSISLARSVFSKALGLDDGKLAPNLHAGLAQCYSQMQHRLAIKGQDVVDRARRSADAAENAWLGLHPQQEVPAWILATQALVNHVDEEVRPGRTKADRRRRYLASAALYYRAHLQRSENEIYANNLGWVMLKVAGWDETPVGSEDGVPEELRGNPAKTAEKFLARSRDLNPANKLCHANLCLLYALPHFRRRRDTYLPRCWVHGLRAINLDGNYINGYRDLALGLLRYGLNDEGHRHFESALERADLEKDMELIADVAVVLDEVQAPAEEIERWLLPRPELLTPHGEVLLARVRAMRDDPTG